MASSSFICHKLIDDIVKRGGQQVSDKYVITKCLNKRVLSNKRIITNQLIKQTGIKGEHCTIQREMVSEPQPEVIKKDEYMYKSLLKFHRKAGLNPKAIAQNRKYFSSSKIKRKMQLHQSDRTSKKLAFTSKTFANSDKQTERNLLIALDIKKQQQLRINIQEQKSIDMIRMKIAKYQQQQLSDKKIKSQKQKQRYIAETRGQKNFEKQICGGTKNHTYDINGKYIVYPESLQHKALAKAFPVSLAISIQASPQNHCKKRKANFKQTPISAISLASNIDFHKTIDGHQCNQNSEKQLQRNQHRQSVFSNNNKRQTSSLHIVHVKPGVCLTEPAQGNSVRGQINEEESTSISKFKTQSTFVKFFCAKKKTDETDDLNNRLPHTQSNKVSKTQFYKDQEDNKSYKLFPKSRPKTSGLNGTIKVNETLLKKWIGTTK